jgi:hypothetical protein
VISERENTSYITWTYARDNVAITLKKVFRIPEYGIRIPELGTRNTDPGSRIPEYGSRNTEYGIRIPDPGIRDKVVAA